MALAWLLHSDGVTAPIIGPRTLAQLDSAQRALQVTLDAGRAAPGWTRSSPATSRPRSTTPGERPEVSTQAPGVPGRPGRAPAAAGPHGRQPGHEHRAVLRPGVRLRGHAAVAQPGAASHRAQRPPVALLLAMVWLAWAYTTWVTNWMDPERIEVRLLLVVLALLSLAMSAALPRAFDDLGWVVGASYAVQQVGRSVFMVVALRGPLQRNFERILAWCAVSGALAVAGGAGRRPCQGAAVAARRLHRRGRRSHRVRDPVPRPVPHRGLDDRGRPLRRAVPGVHPDRDRRVDRHHRRHPVRDAAHHRRHGRGVRRVVRGLGGAVVAVLRPVSAARARR